MAAEHRHMKWDRLGLVLSGLCLIHCLGTPFLLLLFPVIHGFEGLHSSVHWIAALLLVPMAIYAVTQGYSHHRRKIVPVLAGIGGALVILGALAPMVLPGLHQNHAHHWFTRDIVITIVGSFCLLICHGLNIWYCRKNNLAPQCHTGH